jgi:hypothetical protein
MTLMTRTTQWLCAMSRLFGGQNTVLRSERPQVWTLHRGLVMFKGLYTVSSLNLGMSGRPDKASSKGGAPARGEVSFCGNEYGRVLRLPANAYPALVCTALRYDVPHVVRPMENRHVRAGGHPPVALSLRL